MRLCVGECVFGRFVEGSKVFQTNGNIQSVPLFSLVARFICLPLPASEALTFSPGDFIVVLADTGGIRALCSASGTAGVHADVTSRRYC